jgi:putative restriction endonuclease
MVAYLVVERERLDQGCTWIRLKLISDHEYQLILQLGFAKSTGDQWEGAELIAEEPEAYVRPIVEQLTSRPFREAAFTRSIRPIYNRTCAMTGLCIINGGGRPEVEAAHIRPIGNDHNGPDSVRNGMALSRSIHWMFDRGLLSLTDDYKILMVEHLIPDPIKRFLNPDGKILLPADRRLCPHPHFIRYHRERLFKG